LVTWCTSLELRNAAAANMDGGLQDLSKDFTATDRIIKST